MQIIKTYDSSLNTVRLNSGLALRQPPEILFPYTLDDTYTLLQVNNRSESLLEYDLDEQHDEFTIIVDENSPEKWPASGILSIEDEDIHYSEVEHALISPPVLTSAVNKSISEYEPTNLAKENNGVLFDFLSVLDVPDLDNQYHYLNSYLYTLVGRLTINRNIHVIFTVRGYGKHGKGAIFWFSDPKYFDIELCSFDPETMNVFLAPIIFNTRIDWIYWKNDAKDIFGDSARRVYKFKTLIRGYNGTTPSFHPAKSWVRMFILAEHHNLMAQAVLELENLAGVDWSNDQESLDFRLRDLDDRCLENDECPEGILHVEEEVDDCFRIRKIKYRAEISGNAETFEIDFGDGTTTTALEGTHDYPLGVHFEPRLSVANKSCMIDTTPEQEGEREVETIIPALQCPEITCPPPTPINIPEIPPPVPPPTPQSIITLSCPPCTVPTLLADIPTMITVMTPQFPTLITVTGLTDVNINAQTLLVSIIHTFVITGPTAEGPCFALIPCVAGPTGTPAT